jgi:addiction module HigA family antidote
VFLSVVSRAWCETAGSLKRETEMPMKKPPHPGDLIRTEVIEALGLTVSKAAEILQVRRATLSDLLHGKAALTPEMALRIEKAFGPEMDHLLRMQLAYDVAKTREQARGISIKRMPQPKIERAHSIAKSAIEWGTRHNPEMDATIGDRGSRKRETQGT